MDTMEQKTERAAFEAWAEKNWMYVDVKDNSWEVWRAAVAAERERCASLCEEHAGLRGTGAWVALTAAADRIRGLIP